MASQVLSHKCHRCHMYLKYLRYRKYLQSSPVLLKHSSLSYLRSTYKFRKYQISKTNSNLLRHNPQNLGSLQSIWINQHQHQYLKLLLSQLSRLLQKRTK